MKIFDKQRWAIYYELMQIGLEKEECWAEADLILEYVTGFKRIDQITNDLNDFQANWLNEITRIINLRRQRKPLAYCLNKVQFAGLLFKVVPGVLIPRVDTEILVDIVTKSIGNKSINIAEIGVGSGAIIVSLLKRLPQCHAWGCDISEIAIATTLGNARQHKVDDRLTLEHGDWKNNLPNNLDIIVSNPPYIPTSFQDDLNMQPELAFEPKSALFDDSPDGLNFYRQFAKKLPAHFTKKNGLFTPFSAFEIGDTQGQIVLEIFKQSGWHDLQIIMDTNNLPRVLIGSPSPPGG